MKRTFLTEVFLLETFAIATGRFVSTVAKGREPGARRDYLEIICQEPEKKEKKKFI
jgi:hypothetical protein